MKKPNIVLFLTDDQGAWSMGCAGNPDVRTPNMDALAAGGTRFENCFCASPVCSPARASLMTGRIPSRHGVHDWLARGYTAECRLSPALRRAFDDPNAPDCIRWPRSQLKGDHAIRFMEGQRMYTDMLHEAGYTCALSGKWHLGDSATPQNGFTWWKSIAMGGDNYFTPTVLGEDGLFDMRSGVYVTDYITDRAIEFLRGRDPDEPFYLAVHYTAPHAPFDRASHPDEYFQPFVGKPLDSFPVCAPHPWNDWRDGDEWRDYLRMCREGYCAALYGADVGIGRVMDELRAQGLMGENTLILFTGDNGMSVGHHGIVGKGNGTFPVNMYDEAVKVPMIVYWPGHVPQGRVCDAMVSNLDVFPTLCELMNADLPENLPGRSVLKAAAGGDLSGDDVFICDEYGATRMVRTRTHKYVHRYPYGPHELYDLIADPGECVNQVDHPAFESVRAELKARLDRFFAVYSDPEVDGAKEGTQGLGQIDLAGVRAQGRKNYITHPNK